MTRRADSVVIEMGDRDFRRMVQKRGWFFASSRDGGPAHVVTERVGRHHGYTACGADVETTAMVSAMSHCKKCRKKAVKLMMEADK